MTDLSHALGQPAGWLGVPPRRSEDWTWVQERLATFVETPGCCDNRGPVWLWRRLQPQAPPAHMTWGRLLDGWRDAAPDRVREALLSQPAGADLHVWSWNARWLVDQQSELARRKRAHIETSLKLGRVVCLQETHWHLQEERLWTQGLLCGTVYTSNAGPNPFDDTGSTDSRFGGVATLLPPGYKFVLEDCLELVPGHATLCIVLAPDGTKHNIVNCYLQTGHTGHTWGLLMDALPNGIVGHPNTLFVGDFNTDLAAAATRASGDHGHHAALNQGGIVLAPDQPTCTTGNRTIDGALVPVPTRTQWSLTAHRFLNDSDHCAISAVRTSCERTRTQAACTPARFWALPAEARAELRADLAQVALAMGVPPIKGPTPCIPDTQHPRPNETEPGHPVLELLEEAAEPQGSPDAAPVPETVGWMPLLANWGQACLQGAFHRWWRKWRKRGTCPDPCYVELCQLANRPAPEGNSAVAASDTLNRWLQEVDAPAALTAAEAKRWLNVWVKLDRAAAQAQLPRRVAGPTAARDPVQRGVEAGRAIFRKRAAVKKVVDADGQDITDPVKAAEALLDTRRHIWFSRPRNDRDATPIIAAYMAGRRADVPERPPLELGPLRGAVLQPGGSGVGADGTPYEAYHLHPQLVACLIGQAFLLLGTCGQELIQRRPCPGQPHLLDAVLGCSIDLLIWIPKEVGNFLVSAQRPLSLPTCLRRIFGGAGMRPIGPKMEPQLAPGQASKGGGACQDNILSSNKHVQRTLTVPPGQGLPYTLWACQALFGELAQAVIQVCMEYHADAPEDIKWMAAVFLLDQAKAFEYLSHDWLRAVLAAWNLPVWAEAFLLACAEGRRIVGHPRPDWPGEDLLRGVGMGGPASMFTWCLAFDPVSWIAAIAAQCCNRTYVDDLTGETFGPGQTVLLYLCLLAATRLAALQVEDHHCQSLAGPHGTRCRHLLRCFPVEVHVGPDDTFVLHHGPAAIYAKLLIAAGPWTPADLALSSRTCRCKTKHGLVPSWGHRMWADTLTQTPLASAVTHGTRSLGAQLVSCVAAADGEVPAVDNGRELVRTPNAVAACVAGTYQKCLTAVRHRTGEARAAGASLRSRQALWNMQIVSTIPYAASIIPAPDWVCAQFQYHMSVLFPTGNWAKGACVADLGPLLQLKGYPRDPAIVALLTSIITIGRRGLAGPIEGTDIAYSSMRQAADWATSMCNNGPTPAEARHERRAAELLQRAITRFGDFGTGKGLSKALYTCLWTLRRKDAAVAYLLERSRGRRWLPSNGQEWHALRAASCWSDAWVVTRLYLDGLPGNARTRSRADLPEHQCHGCGAQGSLHWRWLSNGQSGSCTQNSVGWCVDCVGSLSHGLAPGVVHTLGSQESVLPGGPVPQRGLYRVCPLCKLGEAGAEHIHIFCAPVRAAWYALRPNDADWRLTADPDDLQELRVRFNHAISWLSCVLAASPVAGEEGYRLICLQVLQRPDGWRVPTTFTHETADPQREDATIDSWCWPGQPGPTPCAHCARLTCAVRTAYRWLDGDLRAADHSRPTATLVADRHLRDTELALELHALTVPALWPQIDRLVFGTALPAERGREDAVNISWATTRCPHCRSFRLQARVCRDIAEGQPLRAAAPPWVLKKPPSRSLLLSFDGGARKQHECIAADPLTHNVAGAGVALWSEPDTTGARRCLAQLTLSAPRIRDSLAAEAAGLSHAVSLMLACLPDPLATEILGDNLGVIRLGAGNARCRCDRVWQETEGALMALAGQRWPTVWTAVRRCYNKTADALATLGVIRSLHNVHRGDHADAAHLWFNRSEMLARGWHPPEQLRLHPTLALCIVDQPLTDVS